MNITVLLKRNSFFLLAFFFSALMFPIYNYIISQLIKQRSFFFLHDSQILTKQLLSKFITLGLSGGMGMSDD